MVADEDTPSADSPADADPDEADPVERLERLERLAELREQGVLTEDEFAAEKRNVLQSQAPSELRRYDRSGLRVDLLAALSVTAVAVPASLGMASLAGVSPVAGIYATLLPLAVYALFSSSRQTIVGPEGALSALTAATPAPLAAAHRATGPSRARTSSAYAGTPLSTA